MTTHEELLMWLESDPINAQKFVRTVDKLVMSRTVLIAGEDGVLITGFMPSKKGRKIRR